MLAEVRAYFAARHVLEIDCCALVRCPSLDSNIDSIEATVSEKEAGYLHTSPEFAMKRLLADGIGDIYYLGHVFRKNDLGRFHNPEFTMIEWYRVGVPFDMFIEEACAVIRLFLGPLPMRRLSYRDALRTYAGIDPFAPHFDGAAAAKRHGIALSSDTLDWSRDDWLHLLMSHAVEPQLGHGELTVISDYPPSQAALARLIERDGFPVAERFEVYFRGIELSNGYHELTDAIEQRRRFEEESSARQKAGNKSHALDERFLAALDKGLPDCCGVSLGFDRLLMQRLELSSIHEVLPFSWEPLFPNQERSKNETPNQLPLVHCRSDLLHHAGELR